MSNKTEKIEATLDEATSGLTVDTASIKLDEPLKRGEKVIDHVAVRKPNTGELRGLGLLELAQMDVSTLEKLLPRITVPTLTKDEVAKLCPADLMQLGVKVANFLLTKQQHKDYPNE